MFGAGDKKVAPVLSHVRLSEHTGRVLFGIVTARADPC